MSIYHTKSKRVQLCVITYLIFFIYSTTMANIFEWVTATGNTGGDAVWKIVKKSDLNETDLEPGIYVRGPNQTWDVPLVKGNVLGRKNSSGIIQLSLSETSNRLEALAVVDGRIHIFHVESSPDDPSSYIVLGDEENPLIDPLRPFMKGVKIPKITSLDDVVVRVQKVQGYPLGQDILISVKDSNSQYLNSTGLTFITRLKNVNDESNHLELEKHPVLLDFNFNTLEKIKKLKVSDGYISFNYIENLINKPSHNPALNIWKNDLRNKLHEARDYEKMPFYDLMKSDFCVPEVPEIELKQYSRYSNIGISNILHPNDYPKIKINGGDRFSSIDLMGEFNFYPNYFDQNKQKKFGEINDSVIFVEHDTINYLLYFNNKLHLIRNDRKEELQVIKLSPAPLDGDLPDEINFDCISYDIDKKSISCIVSARRGDKKGTVFYELHKTYDNYDIQSTYQLKDKYYNNVNNRIYFNSSNKSYFFDYLTKNGGEYSTHYNKTQPHLSIKKTLEVGEFEVGFRVPTRKVIFANGFEYHTYNKGPLKKNYDGIYHLDSEGNYKLIKTGQLLPINMQKDSVSSNSNSDRTNFLISSHTVRTGSGVVYANVVALDQNYNDGKKEFILLYTLNSDTSFQNPRYYSLEMPLPLEELDGVIFFGGNKQQYDKNLNFNSIIAYNKKSSSPNEFIANILDFNLNHEEDIDLGTYDEMNLKVTKRDVILRDFGNSNVLSTLKEKLKSDIIYQDLNGRMKNMFGQTLFLKKAVQQKEQAILDTREIIHPVHGEIKINVYAVDRDFNHGSSNFTLVFEALHNSKTEYFVKNIPANITDLVGLKILSRSSYTEESGRFGFIFAIKSKIRRHKFTSIFFNINDQNLGQNMSGFKIFDNKCDLNINRKDGPSMDEVDQFLYRDSSGAYYWADNNLIHTHRKFRVINLTSGEHIYPNVSNLELVRAFLSDQSINFGVNEGSWRVKKSKTAKNRLPGYFEKLNKEKLDDYENLIFEDLSETLENLGDPNKECKHQVLLVGKALKKYIKIEIAGNWLYDAQVKKNWNYRNKDLSLYYFSGLNDLDQKVISDNFQAMEEAHERGEKTVLFADMEDLIQKKFPVRGAVNVPYEIQIPIEDPFYIEGEKSLQFQDEDNEETRTSNIIYILASDGQVIPLKDFKNRGKPQNSMIIVGTPEEWEDLKGELTSNENSYGVLDSFEVLTLDTPSVSQRRKILSDIVEDKIQSYNGIEYDGRNIIYNSESLSQSVIKEKVLDYAVLRSEALATEKNHNVFVSFVKMLNMFKFYLSKTVNINDRGEVVLDKSFIENIMCDTYSLPLNLRSLPIHDPLKILNQKNAPMLLNDAGYAGNFDIKMRVIHGILGQTNSGDQKTIPGSFVLFGKKGSGKTFLFKTLVKMLDLQYYDFSGTEATNKDAKVFLTNLGNITSSYQSSQKDSEMMSVNSMLTHFDKFLKLPHGSRGFILFDDVHLSSSNVRSEVFSKLRSLFEAKDGKYQDINIRNLSMFMTFNPTQDREKIKKIVEYGNPTPLQLTLATFLGEDNKVDESFFNRWGDIINLDYFSTSAKGNELVNRLNSTTKSYFNFENIYFTVTQDVINKIVQRFPTLNARDFLSTGVKSLSSILDYFQADNPLLMIVPKKKLPFDGTWNESVFSHSSDPSGEQVSSYIKENFRAISITEDVSGFAYFLEMITNNFRVHLYRDIVSAINHNDHIAGSKILQNYKLSPILYALQEHLKLNPKIPLSEFNLDVQEISSHLQMKQLDNFTTNLLDVYKNNNQFQYFPSIFKKSLHCNHDAEYLLGSKRSCGFQVSRQHTLHVVNEILKEQLSSYLKNILYLNQALSYDFNTLHKWAFELPNHEPSDLSPIISTIVEQLNIFMEDFNTDLRLIENMNSEDFPNCTNYDVARVFFYTLDKSITQLSWEFVSVYLIKVLDLLSKDMSIASKPSVQYWLFDSKQSIIRPQLLEDIYESIKSSMIGIKPWDKNKINNFTTQFNNKVESMFYVDK